MGFAASQGRLLMLVARKNELEFQLQFIQQQRMFWGNLMTLLMQKQASTAVGGSMDPNSAAAQQLTVAQARVAQMDKMLEMQGNRLEKQREAIVTEMEAVNKVISKNIQQSFSLMGRG
ncbi:MAG: hypothetical protein IPK79_07685 [Vampirovibrionales bacterium]|nr:hypothetical protein [Vampirovibrionales bacterium]